jgi:NADPH-dependent ferric siderophore reductase
VHGVVESVERLSPQLVRVRLGGPGLDEFVDAGRADAYVNLQFPPPGAPYEVPFDAHAVRELPSEQRPVGRRYTVRAWDAGTRVLTLDFVVHGDDGVAGRWALHAKPGDLLQLKGPGGNYDPSPDANWYLFVGDESALPAIGAALERVPAGRPAVAVLEVEDAAGEIELPSPGDVTLVWVRRDGRHDDDLLLTALRGLELPAGRCDAFVHGEAVETRGVRAHLLRERVVLREDLSVSPYWRRGFTDEEWRKVKKDWQRAVEQDVV